jgi:hypothetical protein
MSAPEVSSAHGSLGAALEARKWLDGQISPPRHAMFRRMRNPAAVTLPLLVPPSAAQEGRPTPRLAPAQPDSQVCIYCPHGFSLFVLHEIGSPIATAVRLLMLGTLSADVVAVGSMSGGAILAFSHIITSTLYGWLMHGS